MNPTEIELAPVGSEELAQIEGGVTGNDGGCIPRPPIKIPPIFPPPTIPGTDIVVIQRG